MMAKIAGRKRKSNAQRTPGGQISRAKQVDPRMTALAQRHRAGRLSEWRGSVVGRFLEDDRLLTKGFSSKALFDAANRFAKHYAAWQGAYASRRPLAVTAGGSSAPEDADRAAKAIETYTRANTVLQQQGHAVRQATHAIICDYRDESYVMPFHVAFHLVEGLKALAEHYGLDYRQEDRRAA
ncbi:MAG: hypothetical protein Q7T60_16980 [Sphingopyxis sp.]|nr:hypothetical protein [Sphingopyxis sp.]